MLRWEKLIINNMDAPILLQGSISIDDRGEVSFVNDFNFSGVKRFYTVKNHRQGFIRAWHGHKKEAKYVTILNGSAIIGAVPVDDWSTPSRKIEVFRFILSSQKPSVLYIPPGYANGFMSLTKNVHLIFFSTSTLEDSKDDDFRFESRYWDIWNIIER
jgi:dTDP-4-dehydrorhamnose 3,5-epimerase